MTACFKDREIELRYAHVAHVLTGNPGDSANPAMHFLRVRLISPAALQPDIQATVGLAWNRNP